MYGLPKQFDGAFLIDRRMEIVSFSENTVYFGFDQNVSITVESSIQHQVELEVTEAAIQKVPIVESRLMALLGHRVSRVSGDTNGTLALVFDNNQAVTIFDDSKQFESYRINDGNQEIFV